MNKRAGTFRQRLGEALLKEGKINVEQLEMALKEQKRTGELLGETLIRLGFVSPAVIADFLARQLGAQRIDLSKIEIPEEVIALIPEQLARQTRSIPVKRDGNTLTVAMVDSFDVKAVDKLAETSGLQISTLSITEAEFQWALNNFYRAGLEDETTIEEIIQEGLLKVGIRRDEEGEALEAPIIRLVNSLINKAVREGATDLHIEPEQKVVRTRYRIDGVLIQGPSIPKELQPALTSRVKIMSGMNIAETRLPQDGRIPYKAGRRDIDIRVSTFPTVNGENLVLRILDRERLVMGLENLGFEKDHLELFRKLIKYPNGIILVTGPTGSGKTTTLYSALLEINTIDKNVITLEDPVEYEFPVIRQSQINPKAGLTFATGLRAIFRQDPDVILVGEIRDNETAEMAVRAALTGHLVFSTLHTNDAAGSISRLVDMGIAPFLLTSSLIAVMAQRLVRLICPKCKIPYQPDPEIAKLIETTPFLEGVTFYKGKGCRECNETGFKGRIAVFEILTLNYEIASLIMNRAPSHIIREAARKAGMRTMREDGFIKVKEGKTTIEEVLRVTPE